MKSPHFILAIGLAALLARPFPAHATDRVWQPNSGSSWTTPANWSGGVPGVGDVAVFNSTTLNPTITTPISVGGLRWDASTGVFVYSGSAITLGGFGLTQYGASNQTINNDLTLSASQNWSGAGGGTLILGGTTTVGGQTLFLDVPVKFVGGTLDRSGGGRAVPSASVTFDGATAQLIGAFDDIGGLSHPNLITFQNGARWIATAGPLQDQPVLIKDAGSSATFSGAAQMGSGSSFNVQSGGTLSAASSFSFGHFAGTSGTVSVDGVGSSFVVGGDSNWGTTGTASVSFSNGATGSIAGTVSMVTASTGAANLNVDSGAHLSVGAFNASSVNGSGAATITLSGTNTQLNQTGANAFTFGASTGGADIFTVRSGAVFTSGSGIVAFGSTAFVLVQSGGTFTATGALSATGGSIQVTQGGRLNVAGANGFQGTGATLSVAGAGSQFTTTGSFFFSGNGTITNGGSLQVGGDFSYYSVSNVPARQFAISGAGASLSAAHAYFGAADDFLTPFSTLSVSNSGSVVFGQTEFLAPAPVVIDGGTADLGTVIGTATGGLSFLHGALTITNDLTIGTGGLFGTALTLDATRTLATRGSTTIEPFRTLTLAGGTLQTSALLNNGILAFQSGTLRITGAAGYTVGGQLTLGSGQNLEVANALLLTSDAQLFLSGTVSAGVGSTIGAGARVTLQNGTGLLAGAGTLTNGGLITGDGRVSKAVTNAGGELRAENGKTLVFTGPNGANSGRLNLLGGTLEFAQPLTSAAAGQINGRGTLNFAGGLVNSGRMNFSAGITDVFGAVNLLTGAKITTSGGGTATFYDAVTHNGAEVRTSAGARTVFFGPVHGAGPFTGAGQVYFENGYSPGNSPALVTSEAEIFFTDASVLTMEIGGLTAGTGYDRLVFNGGAVHFGGTLLIDLIGAFAPAAGEVFDLFDFDPALADGTFSTIELADALPPGLTLDASQATTTGIVAIVPEPSAALLLLLAAGGCLAGARRRRSPADSGSADGRLSGECAADASNSRSAGTRARSRRTRLPVPAFAGHAGSTTLAFSADRPHLAAPPLSAARSSGTSLHSTRNCARSGSDW